MHIQFDRPSDRFVLAELLKDHIRATNSDYSLSVNDHSMRIGKDATIEQIASGLAKLAPDQFTISAVQAELPHWVEHNFDRSIKRGNGFDTINHPMLGCTEELGELSHAILKIQQGIRGSERSHLANARDAIGDLMIYLLDLCNELDKRYLFEPSFNLTQIVSDTWREVRKRDWKANPINGSPIKDA